MNVTLYNNSSPNNAVNKIITKIGDTMSTVNANRPIDVMNPTIVIAYNASYIGANYMYIQEFGRYYYINDIEIENGNIMNISGHVDVLKSFWNSFKGSRCIAERSTSNYNEYLIDSMVNILGTYRTEVRRLSGEFTPTADGANHYVLTIGGME